MRKKSIQCGFCKTGIDAYYAGYKLCVDTYSDATCIDDVLLMVDSIGFGTCDNCISRAKRGINDAWRKLNNEREC